jgi:hypothetical protein
MINVLIKLYMNKVLWKHRGDSEEYVLRKLRINESSVCHLWTS